MTGWAFRGLWFGNGKEIVMGRHIGWLTAVLVFLVVGNLQATIIENNTFAVYQCDDDFTLGADGEIGILDSPDWDITKDTVISGGEYNVVRVDYNNPEGRSFVYVRSGIMATLLSYNKCNIHFSCGFSNSIASVGIGHFLKFSYSF